MHRVPSFLFAKRLGAPYGLMSRWIQLHSRYVSSFLHTSAYSAGDKQYCYGLDVWISGSSKVILYVMRYKGKKTGSWNTSENLSSKAEIYGSLELGARGVWGPSCSPSSMTLAPIARRLLDGHNNMKHAELCDLPMVFIKDLKEHSST